MSPLYKPACQTSQLSNQLCIRGPSFKYRKKKTECNKAEKIFLLICFLGKCLSEQRGKVLESAPKGTPPVTHFALLPVQVELVLANGHYPDGLDESGVCIPGLYKQATLSKGSSRHRNPKT